MRRKQGVPVLLAEPYKARKGTFHMKVWCPNCACYHDHGGIDQQHREAHCSDGPYKRTGYYIKIDMEKPEHAAIVQEYREAKSRGEIE